MKKLSLKTRLVLLYTGMMTIVVFLVFVLLFSISSREILANVENSLEERVAGAFDDVELEDGRLSFDSDLMDLEDGVYLSVYEEGSLELLYGRLPYGFDYDLPFEYGNVRMVTAGEIRYYVLDMEGSVDGYGALAMRGIVSVTEAEQDFRLTLYVALILFPLLIVLTAGCGYLLSRRALSPVSKITRTVQNIQREKDLSKRIHLGEGHDEIYTLAQTFDGLLGEVEAAMQRERQFTSDVAHELRTPLAVVLMQCEELMRGAHLDEEGRRELEVIQRKVTSLSEMVSQLLLLARADQGRERLALERVNFSELCQMVAEEFAEIACGKEISLEARIEPDLFLTGDQTLLIRLLGNLLQNAVNYGRQGGHIWLSAVRMGNAIRAEVRDDGIGIAEQDLPRIWERFYQVDPSRNSDSSGLGLSMVRWIVQAHGGQIFAESELGSGTTFVCLLPAERQA